jgi:hypothetical protein
LQIIKVSLAVQAIIITIIGAGIQWTFGQTTSTGTLLTYTNVNDGFTIKYPQDWTVNDTILGSPILQHAVKITAPNNSGFVIISTRNQTNQTGKSIEEGARLFTTGLPYLKNFRLLERTV